MELSPSSTVLSEDSSLRPGFFFASVVSQCSGSPAAGLLDGPIDVLIPLNTVKPLQLRARSFNGGGAVGTRLWPCALLVASWIATQFADHGRLVAKEQGNAMLHFNAVVEIGAGTGVCGLAAAACGAQVVLTEKDPRTLRLLHENVTDFVRRTACGQKVPCVRRLDLFATGDIEALCREMGPFDMVLCSDVIYEHQLLQPLLSAAAALLRQPGELERRDSPQLVLAVELRPCGVDLLAAVPVEARRHGLLLRD